MSVDLSKPYIVRLCGYNFNLFRQGLHQPYDPTFQYAMVLTMNELIVAFQARTGHTHLYEIILVFNGTAPSITNIPSKLLTFYTSYATIRFNHHMAAQMTNEHYISSYSPAKVASVLQKQAMFYGSFYQADNARMARYLVDRCRDKTLGAAIFLWASTLLGVDAIQNKTCQELLPLLTLHHSIRWTLDIPLFVSYGVFGKLERVDEKVALQRPRQRWVANRAFGLDDSEKTFCMLLDKHWPVEFMMGDILTGQSFFAIKQYNLGEETTTEPRTEPESPTFLEQSRMIFAVHKDT